MKLTFRYSKEDYQELLVLKDSENLLHRRAKLINLVTIIAVIFILAVYTKAKKEVREIGTAEMLMQAFGACDNKML